MPQTVLDYVDNIVVDGDIFKDPYNEYYALIWLRDGLELLYQNVTKFDNLAKQKLNTDNDLQTFVSGNFAKLRHIPQGLLTSFFHWYCMSAYQYVLTVGQIAYNQDNSREIPPNYVNRVIPEVKAFRDKVAAHFAWAKYNNQDSAADKTASIIPQLAFINDSFHIGANIIKQQTKESYNICWSISETHKMLKERYWRN